MNLQFNLDSELWNEIQEYYENGDYTGAIRNGILYLSKIIRDKSDLDGDGIELVNKAFSGDNPRIKINRLDTTSNIDEQKGIANSLRGIYQFIRNPRSHDKYIDSENDCALIIAFLQFLINRIKGSSGQFEMDSFMEQIMDKRFVRKKSYCDALVAEIPLKKFFDTVLHIYKNKTNCDANNLELLFISIFSVMKDQDKESLLKLVSEELRKTTDDVDIKYNVYILDGAMWEKIDKVAKIRTENRILESLKDCHYLVTWCTKIFKYFENRNALFYNASEIIDSDDEKKIHFFYKSIFLAIVKIVKEDDIRLDEEDPFAEQADFLYKIRLKVKRGEKNHYEGVKSSLYSMPKYLRDFFNDCLQEYKENEEKEREAFVDDIPF